MINEYRGYPFLGIRSMLGIGNGMGLGLMAEIERFGVGVYVPFKQSPIYVLSVGIPIIE